MTRGLNHAAIIIGAVFGGNGLADGSPPDHPRSPAPAAGMPQADFDTLRGTGLAMIFQNPASALNPVKRIG